MNARPRIRLLRLVLGSTAMSQALAEEAGVTTQASNDWMSSEATDIKGLSQFNDGPGRTDPSTGSPPQGAPPRAEEAEDQHEPRGADAH